MEDDDTDFTPSSPRNPNTNLANLFGLTRKPLLGNSSLTYAAPRAPKRESSPAKKQLDEKPKGKIIFSKAVQAYKLENRSYVSQGLIGIVISGNHNSRIYEIILYKRTKEHLCQIRISSSFIITLSSNKYVSFYDNSKQNWSIMFQSTEDVEQFSHKIAICKFYSQPEGTSDVLIQDLAPISQQKTNANSTVKVTYSVFSLTPEELSKVKGEIKEEIKLSNYNFTHLSNGLIGSAEKCKRAIIIPHSLSGPWLNELGPNKDLLIEIKVEKIISESENLSTETVPPVDKPPENSNDSSSEDSANEAQGTSVKESLTSTKSQKANLISRMARMGQATLPVKQGILEGQSDSDDESTLSQPKPRLPRSRNTGNVPLGKGIPQTQTQEQPQEVSVYQNDIAWQQPQLNKLGVTYQQLIPVSASSITSPTIDSNLSVYFSETRVQAAELRMGISKISEKLDSLWNKVQSGVAPEHNTHQQNLMDSKGILASIQNLISENESLKGKFEEQKSKIEQQNDRIFNLLELNHKYLERNSTTHDKQHANESKLKNEMQFLHKKEQHMETANRTALDKVKNLEEELSNSEKLNRELNQKIQNLDDEIESLKRTLAENNEENARELGKLRETVGKASETIIKLKEKLREIISENENLKSVIKVQKDEIDLGSQEMKDSKTKNEVYEKTVEDLKQQLLDGESKTEKIESLSKTITILEEENKNLREQKEKVNPRELENVLLKIYSVLKERFSNSKQYSASDVLTTVGRVFTVETNGVFKFEEKSVTEVTEPVVTTNPRTSPVNMEPIVEEQNETESQETVEEEKKKENDSQKNNEVDSRYKSYDQGWRTAKPPPPSLFDEEDEDDEGWIN